MQSLIKQPAEELIKALAFGAGVAIAAFIDVAAVKRGLVPGSADLDVAGALVDGAVQVTMSGGTDGERYLVTGHAEDAYGETIEAELEIAVIDGAWTMPDGGDGYLSIAAFVARFGLEEIVRATDTAGDGRIDRDMLITALAAEQGIVDAYLSARFAVPLADPPELIKTIIADKARARLYSGGAPDGIAAAAKAAGMMLDQIRTGQLPLAGIEVPAAATSEAPVMSTPGYREYADRLRDY